MNVTQKVARYCMKVLQQHIINRKRHLSCGICKTKESTFKHIHLPYKMNLLKSRYLTINYADKLKNVR